MYGTRGTRRRRRAILAEFVFGTLFAFALGVWVLIKGSGLLGDRLFGVWAVGVGLNYLPLACFAVALSRRGALDRELAGVDTARELRRHALLQFWVVVPALFLVLAIRAARRRRRAPSQPSAAAEPGVEPAAEPSNGPPTEPPTASDAPADGA